MITFVLKCNFKMQKVLYTSFIILTLFLIGCSSTNKIAALKPEPDDASPLVYDNTPSYINMPISIKLKEIENQVNQSLNGLIYEDKNIEDDDLEIKIWKLAPITIENDPQNPSKTIKIILPLKALVKYRIGTEKFGVKMYNTQEFDFNGDVNLTSDVALTNWKLNSKTKLKSLDWNESPTVNILGKSVPITYLINPAIKIFRSDIEKSIDDAMAKSMDFKTNVLDALDKICTPFQMSEAYESWLRIVPLELYTTDSKLKKGSISFQMGLKCNIESIVGYKPVSKFNKDKIVLKPVTKVPTAIVANIAGISTYKDASKIIAKNFAGQVFESGKKKVTVKNVEIWHKDGKMIVALDLLGSIEGMVYLSGFPQFNEYTKEIYFDKLDYVLDTKSKLMRTASWMAQGYILKKIQETCRYSIQPNLDEGKQNIMHYLNNYSPISGVFVNGKMEDVKFEKIQMTNKAIIAFINIKGEINVSVNGVK